MNIKIKNYILISVLISFFASVICFCFPIFKIQEIIIENSVQYISKDDIELYKERLLNKNALYLTSNKISQAFDNIAIDTIDYYIEFPSKLYITITEKDVFGYIIKDEYAYLIDKYAQAFYGVALENSSLYENYIYLDIGNLQEDIFLAAEGIYSSLGQGIKDNIASISAESKNDIYIILNNNIKIYWGANDNNSLKAGVLEVLLETQTDKTYFDISIPLKSIAS